MDYKEKFIKLLIDTKTLEFGTFKLKSGRQSPYFFNFSNLNSGDLLREIGDAYAEVIKQNNLSCDVIYGPSYKGIPIAISTVYALSTKYKKNVSYAFNRKEEKDHGEKGAFVGADLTKDSKVVIVDDVITAGTSIKESLDLLEKNENINLLGCIVAVDRQEKTILKDISFPIYSIVTLDEIIEYLYNNKVDGKVLLDDVMKKRIDKYRAENKS